MQASSLPGLRPGEGVGVRVSHRPVEARSPAWRLRPLVSSRPPSVGPKTFRLLRPHSPCLPLRSPLRLQRRWCHRWSVQARSQRLVPEPPRVHRQPPHQQQAQPQPQARWLPVRPRRLRPSPRRPFSWWSSSSSSWAWPRRPPSPQQARSRRLLAQPLRRPVARWQPLGVRLERGPLPAQTCDGGG